MNKKTLRKYFSENLVKKLVAFVLLISFNVNIFAEVVPDPVSIGNARATGVYPKSWTNNLKTSFLFVKI